MHIYDISHDDNNKVLLLLNLWDGKLHDKK